jgi:hypothetical protein
MLYQLLRLFTVEWDDTLIMNAEVERLEERQVVAYLKNFSAFICKYWQKLRKMLVSLADADIKTDTWDVHRPYDLALSIRYLAE